MHHTVTDEPYHILAPRHPHIWWMGHHQVRRLGQQYINSSQYLKEEPCMPNQGQITWPIHTLICKAPQAGKYLDDIWDILHLKLCNTKRHTYTSCFIEIQQRDSKTLLAYVHCFQMEAKRYNFNNDTAVICILSRVSGMHTISQQKCIKRTPGLYWRSSN